MSNSPIVPVGQVVDLLDTDYISATSFEIRFRFDGPVSKIYIAGNQESGSAVTATYRLWQGLGMMGGSGNQTGEVNIADTTTSQVGSFGNSGATPVVGEYTSDIRYDGQGTFRLACAVGANGNAFFSLSVMGVPA